MREIQEGDTVVASDRALANPKLVEQLTRRSKLRKEELKTGPIRVKKTDGSGHAEMQHDGYAGTFTCHLKFFRHAERAAAS